MNPKEVVKSWAKKHKEIIGVLLGGSRAKGTAVSGSDWDFGVQLMQEPTPALVEELTADFPLQSLGAVRILAELNRHFIIASKGYTAENIEVGLGFINIAELLHALKENLHYPIIEQQFEFLKSAEVLYDPQGIIADLRTKEFPDWATRKLIVDSLGLAFWSINKFKKAKGRLLTQKLLYSDIIWYCTKTVAALNKIPLVYKYGYDDFKNTAKSQGIMFIAPENFFEILESAATTQDINNIEFLLQRIQDLTKSN